jgi:hypothetical protein
VIVVILVLLLLASALVIYVACFKAASSKGKGGFGYDESEMYSSPLGKPLLEK